MPKLAHSLNRPVSVAIPKFFGDDAPRCCTLVDIEPAGLWFSGDAVNDQLGKFEDVPPPDQTLAIVFFPFDQIVYVFDPAQFAHLARGLGPRDTPTGAGEPLQRPARISRSGRHHDRQPKKNSDKTR